MDDIVVFARRGSHREVSNLALARLARDILACKGVLLPAGYAAMVASRGYALRIVVIPRWWHWFTPVRWRQALLDQASAELARALSVRLFVVLPRGVHATSVTLGSASAVVDLLPGMCSTVVLWG